jgi:hypothetical protein
VKVRSCSGLRTVACARRRAAFWLVSFNQYNLGYFDLEQKNLAPLDLFLTLGMAEQGDLRSLDQVGGAFRLAHRDAGQNKLLYLAISSSKASRSARRYVAAKMRSRRASWDALKSVQ